MIKGKLKKLIESEFNGVNSTADGRGKYHPLYIEQYLNAAFIELMIQLFSKNMSNFDRYCKRTGGKGIDILLDEPYNLYYIELPYPVIQLPDVAEGVRRILPAKSSGNADPYKLQFIPLKRDSWDIWGLNNVYATNTNGEVGYSVTTSSSTDTKQFGRVEFYKLNINQCPTIQLYLVPQFDVYGENEDVPLPAGAAVKLINIMRELMNRQQPSDKINNGIPN